MARRGKTRAQDLIVAARRGYVFELRASGANYQLIYQTIRDDPRWRDLLPKSYNTQKVHADVVKELERRGPLQEHVEAVRQLELETLDTMKLALWPRATSGDVGAIDRVLDIMQQRARYLLGLEVPQRVAPTTPDGSQPYDAGARERDLLALAQVLGVPRDALPSLAPKEGAPE